MNIHLAIGGKTDGPFTLDEVKEMLQRGKISAMTLAWHDGAAEWAPLGVLLKNEINFAQLPPPLPRQAPLAEAAKKNPGIGLASFWISVLTVPFWIILLVVAGAAHHAGAGDESAIMIAVGLILFVGVGVNALGLILGGVAATQKGVKLVLTWIGTALNLCQILGIIGLVVLGLTMK